MEEKVKSLVLELVVDEPLEVSSSYAYFTLPAVRTFSDDKEITLEALVAAHLAP